MRNYIIPSIIILFVLFIMRKRIWIYIKGAHIKFYWVYAWYDLYVGLYWSRRQNSLYFLILGVGFKIHFHKFEMDDAIDDVRCKHCKDEPSYLQQLKMLK